MLSKRIRVSKGKEKRAFQEIGRGQGNQDRVEKRENCLRIEDRQQSHNLQKGQVK